jgi:hypothetical protein
VADRPLRPATDHSHGGPLPHHQANRTRAHPPANQSLATPSRERRHPVLAAVSRGCPEPEGRFPRVTHPSATRAAPEGATPVRLACVRRAASVRSEPGSNSQFHPDINGPLTAVRPGPRRTGTPIKRAPPRARPDRPAPQRSVSPPSTATARSRGRDAPGHRPARPGERPRCPKPATHVQAAARASLPSLHLLLKQQTRTPGRHLVESAPCRAGGTRFIVVGNARLKPFSADFRRS